MSRGGRVRTLRVPAQLCDLIDRSTCQLRISITVSERCTEVENDPRFRPPSLQDALYNAAHQEPLWFLMILEREVSMRRTSIVRLLLAVLLVAFAVSGCNSSQSPTAQGDDSAEESSASTTPTLSDVQGADGLYQLGSDGQAVGFTNTVIELLGAGKEDDLSYGEELIANWESHKTGTSFERSDIAPDFYLYGSGEPTVIDRTDGEKLIVISTDGTPSVYIWPVVYSGYSQADGVAGYPEAYEEIGGVDADDISALSDAGIYFDTFRGTGHMLQTFISDTPQTFPASWYEGTQWVDGKLELSTPFYVALRGGLPNDRVELIGTRDGYMEVDISSLDAGLYIISSYRPSIDTIIEVK